MFGDIQLSTMGIFHRLQWFRAKNDVVICLQKYIGIYSEYFSQIREVQGQKRRSRMFGIIQLSTLSNFHSLQRFRAKNDVVICFEIYSYLLRVFLQIREVQGQKRRSRMFGVIQLSTLSNFLSFERFRAKNDVVICFELYGYLLKVFFHRLERFRAKNDVVVYRKYIVIYSEYF